jgi:tetratricopeptide (TPR) repeat protein
VAASLRFLAALSLAIGLVIGVSPLVADSTDSAELQIQIGNLLFGDARYVEALDAYERALRAGAQPTLARARMGVIRTALRIAEFVRARTEAVELLKARARDPEAVALYGDALWANGLFLEAEDTFRDALALDPDYGRARHGLSRSLAARNRLDEALVQAQAALKTMPTDAEIHHTIGTVLERLRRFDEAGEALTQYVNLLPNRDRSLKAAWARNEIAFLKSFAGRTPFDMADRDRGVLHTLPFRLVKDKVIVRAKVNDRHSMDFVVDTGSEQTVISAPTANRLGIRGIVRTLSAGVGEIGLRGLQLGRLNSLTIGTMRLENVPCLIKNPGLRGIPVREGESFSPLALGLSMTIDYGRRELTIASHLPEERFDFELPLRLHRLALVRGTVEGDPVNFIIDTGGEVISISTDTASAIEPDPQVRKIPLKVYGTSGWDRDAFLLPGVNLAFDQIEFPNFPLVVLNLRAPSVLLGFQVGGIVGHRFLSKYRVAVDLDRSVLRLRRLQTPIRAGA